MFKIIELVIGPIGKAVFGVIKPLIAPFLAYLKGRSEGRKNEQLKSRKNFDKVTNRGAAARDKSRADRVPDDSDPNNRD